MSPIIELVALFVASGVSIVGIIGAISYLDAQHERFALLDTDRDAEPTTAGQG